MLAPMQTGLCIGIGRLCLMSEEKVPLSDDLFFADAVCKDMTQSQVSDSDICSSCEKHTNCLHYAVNNNIDGFMARMSSEQRREWIRKAVLSGEEEGNITLRRCHQHVNFIINQNRSFVSNYCEDYCNCSSLNYESLYFDTVHTIQDQTEPKIDDVSKLPMLAVLDFIGDGKQYLINKNKYIGEEFYHNPDLLVLGGVDCLPVYDNYDNFWLDVLIDKFNLKVNNFSLLKASLPRLVQNLFYHLKTFGSPKKLVIILDTVRSFRIPLKAECTGTDVLFRTVDLLPLADAEEYHCPSHLDIMGFKSDLNKYNDNLEYNKSVYYKAIQDNLSYLNVISSVSDLMDFDFSFFTLEEESHEILTSTSIKKYCGLIERKNINIDSIFQKSWNSTET